MGKKKELCCDKEQWSDLACSFFETHIHRQSPFKELIDCYKAPLVVDRMTLLSNEEMIDLCIAREGGIIWQREIFKNMTLFIEKYMEVVKRHCDILDNSNKLILENLALKDENKRLHALVHAIPID